MDAALLPDPHLCGNRFTLKLGSPSRRPKLAKGIWSPSKLRLLEGATAFTEKPGLALG